MKKFVTAAATLAFGMTAQPVFAQAFSGPYVGVEVSRDAYEVQAEDIDFGGSPVSADGLSGNGVAGGLYAGYDMRVGSAFYGIEANADYSSASVSLSATDGTDTESATVKARESYGISARAGALLNDSTGLYVKVGYRGTRFKTSAALNGATQYSESRTKGAFVYGAGIETAFSNAASLRVEYTIADYNSAGLNDDLGVTGISVIDSKVAAGLSWTF
ncbi:MAG: outer membrane beta-barrel protein [Croceibacterium sp.]